MKRIYQIVSSTYILHALLWFMDLMCSNKYHNNIYISIASFYVPHSIPLQFVNVGAHLSSHVSYPGSIDFSKVILDCTGMSEIGISHVLCKN